VVKVAMQHLAAGKRNLLVLDLQAAVTSLGECSEMLGKHYGETAKECGEPYFLYGKALLELARLEAGVIDNGLDGGRDRFVFLWLMCYVLHV
jgi:nuclear autoantigenic sperm protein